MTTIKVDLTEAAWRSAVLGAKDGDSFVPSGPGTLVLNNPLPVLSAAGVSFYLDDLLMRMVLRPGVSKVERLQMAAMSGLGLSGAYAALNKTDKARVDSAMAGADPTGVNVLVDALLATLKPVRDSRMMDANVQRQGQISYNGRSFSFDIGWHSWVDKGLVTTKMGRWGTYARGAVIENAREEGGDYSAAGIRVQNTDLFLEEMTFRDCEMGMLSGAQQVANSSGDWSFQTPPTKYDTFGYVIDVDCEYDNCGAVGKSHGRYGGETLFDLSIRARGIRANEGHFLKGNGGLQMVLGAQLNDPVGSQLVQAVDLTSGVCLLINSSVTKATIGAGNGSSPVLFRNNREPVPSWFECAAVVKGNVITYTLDRANPFVSVVNADSFKFWPGVPRGIRTEIDSNVFRCPAGNWAASHPIEAPGDAKIGVNVVLDMNAAVPDPRIPLPNYEWSRGSWKSDLADLLAKVDPSGSNAWEAKLFASPIYPAGIVVSTQEDPEMIKELQEQVAAQAEQIAQLTADSSAKDVRIADLQEKLAADEGKIAKAAGDAALTVADLGS